MTKRVGVSDASLGESWSEQERFAGKLTLGHGKQHTRLGLLWLSLWLPVHTVPDASPNTQHPAGGNAGEPQRRVWNAQRNFFGICLLDAMVCTLVFGLGVETLHDAKNFDVAASGIVRFLVLTFFCLLVKVKSAGPVMLMATASSVFLIVKICLGDVTSAWDSALFGAAIIFSWIEAWYYTFKVSPLRPVVPFVFRLLRSVVPAHLKRLGPVVWDSEPKTTMFWETVHHTEHLLGMITAWDVMRLTKFHRSTGECGGGPVPPSFYDAAFLAGKSLPTGIMRATSPEDCFLKNCPAFAREVDGEIVVDLVRYSDYAAEAGYERYGGKVVLSIPDDGAPASILSIAPGNGAVGVLHPGDPGYATALNVFLSTFCVHVVVVRHAVVSHLAVFQRLLVKYSHHKFQALAQGHARLEFLLQVLFTGVFLSTTCTCFSCYLRVVVGLIAHSPLDPDPGVRMPILPGQTYGSPAWVGSPRWTFRPGHVLGTGTNDVSINEQLLIGGQNSLVGRATSFAKGELLRCCKDEHKRVSALPARAIFEDLAGGSRTWENAANAAWNASKALVTAMLGGLGDTGCVDSDELTLLVFVGSYYHTFIGDFQANNVMRGFLPFPCTGKQPVFLTWA